MTSMKQSVKRIKKVYLRIKKELKIHLCGIVYKRYGPFHEFYTYLIKVMETVEEYVQI